MGSAKNKRIEDGTVFCIRCQSGYGLYLRKEKIGDMIYCKRCGSSFHYKITKYTYDWVFKQLIPNMDNNWKFNGRWK
jgi:transcription elongation factor Elf1